MFKGFQKPKRLVANTETLNDRYGIPQRAALWVQQGGTFQKTVLPAKTAGMVP